MFSTTKEATLVVVNAVMEGASIIVTPRDQASTKVLRAVIDGMPDTLFWNFQGSRYGIISPPT
jgi:hypothetical protein